MFGRLKRQLKTFVKDGKRFRVVYSTSDYDRAYKSVRVYRSPRHYATVYFDGVTKRYLVGVKAKR